MLGEYKNHYPQEDGNREYDQHIQHHVAFSIVVMRILLAKIQFLDRALFGLYSNFAHSNSHFIMKTERCHYYAFFSGFLQTSPSVVLGDLESA